MKKILLIALLIGNVHNSSSLEKCIENLKQAKKQGKDVSKTMCKKLGENWHFMTFKSIESVVKMKKEGKWRGL